MELRNYQKDIVEKVLSSTKNEVVGLPTGAGKTVIAKALIDGIKETVLFVAPRIDLVLQSNSTFGDVDIIWSNRTVVTGKHCIVATKQSLLNRTNLVPKDVVIIFDECHIGMDKNKELVDLLQPKRVIGLTATPETMSGRSFVKNSKYDTSAAIYDEVNYYYSICDLQKDGWLSPLECHYYTADGIKKVKTNKFDEEIKGSALRKYLENSAEVWKNLKNVLDECASKPTIIFTPDIATAEQVLEFAKNNGFNYEIITGEANTFERKAAYEKLSNHTINGLINAALLTYGFDCPAAKNAILFRHIKSRPLYVQIVGRVLRPYNNETAVLYDILDSNSEFIGINQQDLFKQPINWRYEGFDSDISAAELAMDAERLAEHKQRDPGWVDFYNKDPVKALWQLYEDTVDNAEAVLFEYQQRLDAALESWKSSLQERTDAEISRINNQAKKTGDKLVKALEQAEDAREHNFRYYLSAIYPNEQKFLVSMTLKEIDYDCSEYDTRRIEAVRAVLDKVDSYYKENITKDDIAALAGRLEWWLRHFTRNFKRN